MYTTPPTDCDADAVHGRGPAPEAGGDGRRHLRVDEATAPDPGRVGQVHPLLLWPAARRSGTTKTLGTV